MSKKSLIVTLIVVVIIIILAVILIILLPKTSVGPQVKEVIAAATEKGEYKISENGRIKITNNSDKKICFSSCYPYLMEIKSEEGFKNYSYLECESSDLAVECIEPQKDKTFEFAFDYSEEGTHRLAIPLCSNCDGNGQFKEEIKIYSNEFNLSK